MNEPLTEEQLLEYSARAMGWIDYPTDSIEQGSKWHLDPSKAPFGRAMFKSEWNPLKDYSQCFWLETQLRLSIKISNDDSFVRVCKTGEPHSSITEWAADHAPIVEGTQRMDIFKARCYASVKVAALIYLESMK